MTSARKNAIPAYKLLTAQSLASSFQSDPITLSTATHIGFACSTASVTANTGTFGVQFRVFKDINLFSDWIDLSFATAPSLVNANAQLLLDITVPPGQVRLKFTPGGATPNGTVTVWISGDQV